MQYSQQLLQWDASQQYSESPIYLNIQQLEQNQQQVLE